MKIYDSLEDVNMHIERDFKFAQRDLEFFEKEFTFLCKYCDKNSKSAILINKNQLFYLIDNDLYKHTPNNVKKFIISTDCHLYNPDDETYTKNEIEKIISFQEKLSAEGKSISFIDGTVEFSLEEVILSSTKINSWADEINTTTLDGKELSPLEKFYYAYEIVTSRAYVLDKNEDAIIPRNLISVLNTDHIVCVGFAKLLYELCKRIGIECYIEPVYVKNGTDEKDKVDESNGLLRDSPNHLACSVFINDKKYNVQGFYLSDPTNDCKSNGQTLNLSLITYNEHEKIYSSNETLYTDLRLLAGKYNKETTKYILDKQLTKPITVTQGKHALASVFRARNINKKQSLLYIQRSVYRALKNDHLLNGDNWISTLALALQSQRQSRNQMDVDPYSGLD